MNNSIKQVLQEEYTKLHNIAETINACKISKEGRLPESFPPDRHWDEQEEINKIAEALTSIENGTRILKNLVIDEPCHEL